MKIIRHKTPTEECFLSWVTNHPESFHDLDERRFYQFAHCVFSYNAKNWLNKEYFRKRILDGDGYIQRQVINNEIKEVIITKDEFNHNGISKKEFINRMNDSNKQN